LTCLENPSKEIVISTNLGMSRRRRRKRRRRKKV
jgi:hypothetical protein